MIAKKWNFKDRRYRTFTVSDDAVVYEKDPNTIVACANCGMKVAFGKTHASLVIHYLPNMGYAVCEDCHNDEVSERIEWGASGHGA